MAKDIKKYETEFVELPIDESNKNDDVFVSVNNYKCIIRRGERVEVPKPVAEVINRMLKNDTKTLKMISKLENNFSERIKRI